MNAALLRHLQNHQKFDTFKTAVKSSHNCPICQAFDVADLILERYCCYFCLWWSALDQVCVWLKLNQLPTPTGAEFVLAFMNSVGRFSFCETGALIGFQQNAFPAAETIASENNSNKFRISDRGGRGKLSAIKTCCNKKPISTEYCVGKTPREMNRNA